MLCCLYSFHNEVIVAALELIETIVSLTPYPVLNFLPFSVIESKCPTIYNSPFKFSKCENIAKKVIDVNLLNDEKLLEIENKFSNLKTKADTDDLLLDGEIFLNKNN